MSPKLYPKHVFQSILFVATQKLSPENTLSQEDLGEKEKHAAHTSSAPKLRTEPGMGLAQTWPHLLPVFLILNGVHCAAGLGVEHEVEASVFTEATGVAQEGVLFVIVDGSETPEYRSGGSRGRRGEGTHAPGLQTLGTLRLSQGQQRAEERGNTRARSADAGNPQALAGAAANGRARLGRPGDQAPKQGPEPNSGAYPHPPPTTLPGPGLLYL